MCDTMKSKKEFEEMLKKMKDAPCCYPGCDTKSVMQVALPVLTPLEGGVLEPSEGMGVTVPFCMYHFFVASTGCMGAIQSEKGTRLHAPFEMIQAAEAVYNAKEAMKNNEEELKKIKEGLGEVKPDLDPEAPEGNQSTESDNDNKQ